MPPLSHLAATSLLSSPFLQPRFLQRRKSVSGCVHSSALSSQASTSCHCSAQPSSDLHVGPHGAGSASPGLSPPWGGPGFPGPLRLVPLRFLLTLKAAGSSPLSPPLSDLPKPCILLIWAQTKSLVENSSL